MKYSIALLILVLSFTRSLAQDQSGFQVSSPQDLQTGTFHVASERSEPATFGEIVIRIDLGSKSDNLYELAIRRQELQLPDGRFVTSIGYDQDNDIVVGAVAPVEEISVIGVETTDTEKRTFLVFYDENHDVIAPDPDDISVFDGQFNRLPSEYEPLFQSSTLGLAVSLLIDGSSSMQGFMPDALEASRSFLTNLPDFTKCQIILFNSTVAHLTPNDLSSLVGCPESKKFLDDDIDPNGKTALFQALGDAFTGTEFLLQDVNSTVPRLVIVITDGINTVNSTYSQQQLVNLKENNNIKTFVFWAGNHQPDHLNGLADQEIIATDSIKETLEIFLEAIQTSVSGIQTITTR